MYKDLVLFSFQFLHSGDIEGGWRVGTEMPLRRKHVTDGLVRDVLHFLSLLQEGDKVAAQNISPGKLLFSYFCFFLFIVFEVLMKKKKTSLGYKTFMHKPEPI